jgi:uroporphyrinogen decarboxylase
MNSRTLVKETFKGNNPGRTPLYGWVRENLAEPISERFGSVEAFEDAYRFDMAHIFGCPNPFVPEVKTCGVEVTPEVLLQFPMADIVESDYADLKKSLDHHNQRERFCYVQTNGIFEALNDAFGIENHLMYLALYPDELKEVYDRMARWNIRNARNLLDFHVDGIHVSDDWGAQNSLMFSKAMFDDLILPYHRMMTDSFRKSDALISLHSDGCILPVLDDLCDLGYDFIHPWQETAGMPYSLYLDKYRDRFGILGGICIQSTLGFGDLERLESEIRRVFALLKGKRWACCTTHFVQKHCSLDELVFAFDLARKLADA